MKVVLDAIPHFKIYIPVNRVRVKLEIVLYVMCIVVDSIQIQTVSNSHHIVMALKIDDSPNKIPFEP
jgi:hypothetical protein